MAVFLYAGNKKYTDLSAEYRKTDSALQAVEWRRFGEDKIFDSKLRFQIRVDDFR